MATKKPNNLKVLLISFSIISLLFIIIPSWLYIKTFAYLGLSNDQEVWAQFGDFMGGTLNPLLAFSSFIALLYTIKIQTNELELSRNVLLETQKEAKRSAFALEEQSNSLKLQNKATSIQIFENTFFKILEMHISIKNELTLDVPYNLVMYKTNISLSKLEDVGKSTRGVKAIRACIEMFLIYAGQKDLIENEKRITKIYNEFSSKYIYFENYFNSLLILMEFIIKNSPDEKYKEQYSNILKAQFTNDELYLLFYYGINYDNLEFKYKLNELEFFSNLNYFSGKLIGDYLLTEYEVKAYGRNVDCLDNRPSSF